MGFLNEELAGIGEMNRIDNGWLLPVGCCVGESGVGAIAMPPQSMTSWRFSLMFGFIQRRSLGGSSAATRKYMSA